MNDIKEYEKCLRDRFDCHSTIEVPSAQWQGPRRRQEDHTINPFSSVHIDSRFVLSFWAKDFWKARELLSEELTKFNHYVMMRFKEEWEKNKDERRDQR